MANLVKNIQEHGDKLTTGFIGTPYLNPALSDNGRDDVAFTLFEQKDCPSWLYPVLQGATTMWERWNSYTIENGFGPVDMNSFNHYAYGAIGEWMYAYLLGFQRDEDRPAYKHILLQPRVGGDLEYVSGGFRRSAIVSAQRYMSALCSCFALTEGIRRMVKSSWRKRSRFCSMYSFIIV